MFVAIYHKTTKKLVQYRHDMSVPQVHTAQYYFDMFLEDNEIGDEDYAFAEIPFVKAYNKIEIGNHVYNSATNQVEADPSYVPVVDATSAEPTV